MAILASELNAKIGKSVSLSRNAKLHPHSSADEDIEAARRVAPAIVARAAQHDRTGSFGFENFDDL